MVIVGAELVVFGGVASDIGGVALVRGGRGQLGCRALGGVATSQWGAGPTRVCGRGLEVGLWKRRAWLRRLWAWLHPKGGVAIPAGGVVIPVGGGGAWHCHIWQEPLKWGTWLRWGVGAGGVVC